MSDKNPQEQLIESAHKIITERKGDLQKYICDITTYIREFSFTKINDENFDANEIAKILKVIGELIDKHKGGQEAYNEVMCRTRGNFFIMAFIVMLKEEIQKQKGNSNGKD